MQIERVLSSLDSKGMDSIEAPVEIGDPILTDIFGTDIVDTKQIL